MESLSVPLLYLIWIIFIILENFFNNSSWVSDLEPAEPLKNLNVKYFQNKNNTVFFHVS